MAEQYNAGNDAERREERRKGKTDRRGRREDRRNADRASEEFMPRRDPERGNRRRRT